jgi:hypothetical protein
MQNPVWFFCNMLKNKLINSDNQVGYPVALKPKVPDGVSHQKKGGLMKGLLLSAALAATFGQIAMATPELNLVSGAVNSGTVIGSGSNVSYSNSNFNGWNISVVFGASNSPNLAGVNGLFGIDITSLTATCTGGNCSAAPLDIFLTDTGFTQAVGVGGFTTSYSSTQSGGSTTETAWEDAGNTAFAQTTLIGTVGPFTGTNHGTASGGGPAGPTPYSLTIEDIFNANSGAASFSTDGNITSVPEPGAVVLFGTVLVLCASGLQRRRRLS